MTHFGGIVIQLVLFLLFSFQLTAQDTIRFTNNMTKVVTVVEVGTNEVKCRSYDTLIKKTFYYNRKDIFTITYENGKVDTLSKPTLTIPTNLFFDTSAPNRISFNDNRLYYQNTQITYAECKKIMIDRAIQTSDPNLIKHLNRYNNNRANQKRASVIGIVLCVVGVQGLAYSGIAYMFEHEAANGGLILSSLCLVGGVTSFILSGQVNKQKKKDYQAAIDAHNNTYK